MKNLHIKYIEAHVDRKLDIKDEQIGSERDEYNTLQMKVYRSNVFLQILAPSTHRTKYGIIILAEGNSGMIYSAICSLHRRRKHSPSCAVRHELKKSPQ